MNGQFSFDGVPRGGFSRAVVQQPAYYDPDARRRAFLQQQAEERERRSAEKARLKAARRIQAAYRGYAVRKCVGELLRAEVDRAVGTGDLRSMAIRLCLIFSPSKDLDRLVSLAQAMLSRGREGRCEEWMKTPVKSGSLLARTLSACLKCLEQTIQPTDRRFAPLLRTLEDFGLSNFEGVMLLVNGGYLRLVLRLMESRLSSEEWLSELREAAPSHAVDALYHSLVRPIDVVAAVGDSEATTRLLRSIAKDILSSRNPAALGFVIPSLSRKAGFLGTLLPAVLSEKGDLLPDIQPLSVFAYSLLSLAQAQIPETWSGKKGLVLSLGAAAGKLAEGVGTLPPPVSDFCRSALSSQNLLHTLALAPDNAPSIQERAGLVWALAELCEAGERLKEGDGVSPLVSRLSFQPGFVRDLWAALQSLPSSDVRPESLLMLLASGREMSARDRDRLAPLLTLFCSLFGHLLSTVDDTDFSVQPNVLPTGSVVPVTEEEFLELCTLMRDTSLSLIERSVDSNRHANLSASYQEAISKMGTTREERERARRVWLSLFEAVVSLVGQLHARDSRLHICPPEFWARHCRPALGRLNMLRRDKRGAVQLFQLHHLTREELEERKGSLLSPAEMRSLTVLRRLPFLVPFTTRLGVLQTALTGERRELGLESGWAVFAGGRAVRLRIRRSHIYEDAFEQLTGANEPPSYKDRFLVQLVNWEGLPEAGIDGGGLFREFLSELLSAGFNPTLGLFAETPESRLLHPNPLASVMYPDTYQAHFRFLGRMVGKLIYEGQLAELHFAEFFLAKLLLNAEAPLIPTSHFALLKGLHPSLYQGLRQLRSMSPEEVADLYLDFSVTVSQLGQTQVVELKPGGSDIPLTHDNRLEYIHLVADFHLNRQVAVATMEFREGLMEIVDGDWLGLFAPVELQLLIAGDDEAFNVEDWRRYTVYGGLMEIVDGDWLGLFAPVELQLLIAGDDEAFNVEDWRRYTVYGGGYSDTEPTVEFFWETVREMTCVEKQKLLKFTTACSRPPLQGFKDLEPRFTLYKVSDPERLPTAATCMNFLKLPAYPSLALMKERLLYAIQADAGFELS